MNDVIQEQLKNHFLAILEDGKAHGLPNYHRVGWGRKQIEQRETYIRSLVVVAQELTVDAKLEALEEITERFPKYKTYWLIASLGGDVGSLSMRKRLLSELDERSMQLTAHTVKERISERDQRFVEEFTVAGRERFYDTIRQCRA